MEGGGNTKSGDERKADVLDAMKYIDCDEYDAERIREGVQRSRVMQPSTSGMAVLEAQQQWFNNTDFQRLNHEIACEMLRIEDTNKPRLKGMRLPMLKF